ncbi:sialic acid-binding Ig-like lectin 14 [Gambusia affinis]|uniref:sialic acid-binding Ig-like lectin 14 n=1 Tax=Gambusia affinis TaxID=33528 RepID=UPI001CDB871C|nr:sialic acid-binding Ig-like lectin 14 [Gambusia affinis]
MVGLLIYLLIGSAIQGTNCNSFQVNLAQTVHVMTGSCVTIPCSFDVTKKHQNNLNGQCVAKWYSSKSKQLTDRDPVIGNLEKKDCTTTFNKMQTHDNESYHFRLECNDLKYNFQTSKVKIEVTDDFPSPILTPSTLKIKEGESVSLMCSAPAPCLPHPPTLTWTPTLGDIQETLQENLDKTKFKTSVLNFTASHLHNKQNISCTAVYKKQDGSSDAALTTRLMPDVLFPSQILFSSNCTKTANQLNCSCETVGNPTPMTHWFLNGQSVSQSSQMVVTNEFLDNSHLRSIITVNEPQNKDLSTLLCFSSNSLGSASKQLFDRCLESLRENQGQIPLFGFIATVAAFVLVVFALLVFIWFQKTHSKTRGIGGDIDTNAYLMKEENQVPNMIEDAIYANTAELSQAGIRQPSNGIDNEDEIRESSGKKSEDLVYAHVHWSRKSKTKKPENDANMNFTGSSFLEEEKFARGDMLFVSSALEMGSLYAEVKPRNVKVNMLSLNS